MECDGTKKNLHIPIWEMKATRHSVSHPCLWRDSCPSHGAEDLMSDEKQVF